MTFSQTPADPESALPPSWVQDAMLPEDLRHRPSPKTIALRTKTS
jgi:hypothetical protein